jgi:hypothetical protein
MIIGIVMIVVGALTTRYYRQIFDFFLDVQIGTFGEKFASKQDPKRQKWGGYIGLIVGVIILVLGTVLPPYHAPMPWRLWLLDMKMFVIAQASVSAIFIVAALLSLSFPRRALNIVARRYQRVVEQRRRAGRSMGSELQAAPSRKTLALFAILIIVSGIITLVLDMQYLT